MTTAIKLSHVTKTYPRKRRFQHFWQTLVHSQYERHEALYDMSFTVPAGQIMGYIGPNGAGKSTTIKLMTRVFCSPIVGVAAFLGRTPCLTASGLH